MADNESLISHVGFSGRGEADCGFFSGGFAAHSRKALFCVQVINIVTLGSPDGKGVFFPSGLYGAINKPTGYNVTASGLDSFPSSGAKVASQVCINPFPHSPDTLM